MHVQTRSLAEYIPHCIYTGCYQNIWINYITLYQNHEFIGIL